MYTMCECSVVAGLHQIIVLWLPPSIVVKLLFRYFRGESLNFQYIIYKAFVMWKVHLLSKPVSFNLHTFN